MTQSESGKNTKSVSRRMTRCSSLSHCPCDCTETESPSVLLRLVRALLYLSVYFICVCGSDVGV